MFVSGVLIGCRCLIDGW